LHLISIADPNKKMIMAMHGDPNRRSAMDKKHLNLIVSVFTFLAMMACAAGNHTQRFERIKSDYQKTGDLEPLIEALADTDLRIRALAASYLGGIKNPAAIEPLKAALNDRSRYVREEAAQALEKLGVAAGAAAVRSAPPAGPFPKPEAIQNALVNSRPFSTGRYGTLQSVSNIKSLDFSPNGRFLAAGYTLGGYVIWDVVDGQLFARTAYYRTGRFASESQRSTSVKYSPDGRFLAIGDGWRVNLHREDGAQKWYADRAHGVAHGTDIRTSVTIAPRSEYVISGGQDGAVKVWDLRRGAHLRNLADGGDPVTAVAVSPDGARVVAGNQMGRIRLWDLASGRLATTLAAEAGAVNCLAFTPDSRYLVSGGDAGTIKLWDAGDGHLLKTIPAHAGPVKAVAVSHDGRFVSSGGNDRAVNVWRLDDGRLLRALRGHTNWVEAVAFAPGDAVLASGGRDGRLILWDIDDGTERARLVNIAFEDWLVVNPEGFFNTSVDAAASVKVFIDHRQFNLGQFFPSFYHPEIIKKVLSGADGPKADLSAFSQPPPEVRIVAPVDGAAFDENLIDVTVRVHDRGGGVENTTLFHNGRRVSDEGARGLAEVADRRSYTRTYRLQLAAGVNTLVASAFNQSGLPSRPHAISVTNRRAPRRIALHALVVGINQYRNGALNLNYAEPDARAIERFIKNQDRRLFSTTSVTTLLNESATGAAIQRALSDLGAQASPQDVVVIYFCGHGQTLDNQWYFIPHDLLRPERDEEIRRQGVSSQALAQSLAALKAQKVLLILDACYSGEALLAFRGYEDRRALMQLARSNGIYIIAASTRDQFAAEVKALGHGIFTYTLLQGLNGKASYGANKTVTVKKLLAYVEEQMPLLSQQFKQIPQYPVVYSVGMDFPLTIADEADND
jgi:WD40 repeat protein